MKLKDLPVSGKIVEKHKKVMKTLWVITYIIFFPFALLQIINDTVDKLLTELVWLRSKIVYVTFKIIYKQEIEDHLRSIKDKE